MLKKIWEIDIDIDEECVRLTQDADLILLSPEQINLVCSLMKDVAKVCKSRNGMSGKGRQHFQVSLEK